jgi:hypothetical protein
LKNRVMCGILYRRRKAFIFVFTVK